MSKYTLLIVTLLAPFILWAESPYVAIVIDGNKINDISYKNIYKEVPTVLINSRFDKILQGRGKIEVYDVKTGQIIASLKKSKRIIRFKKSMIDLVSQYGKLRRKDINSSNISLLAKTIDNIRINSQHSKFSSAEIYFIDSLLVKTEVIDFNENKGFPNMTCLDKKLPIVFNKSFTESHPNNIYVYNTTP